MLQLLTIGFTPEINSLYVCRQLGHSIVTMEL